MKILVLNADALHLGYLGCYGNEWVATPALNRLAAEGVVFDQHYADGPATARSCWTGRYHFPTGAQTSATALPDLRPLLEAGGVSFVWIRHPTEPVERTLEATQEALAHLGAAERWLVWVDLPSLMPPWQVADAFLDRYFTEPAAQEPAEDEESEEDEEAFDEEELDEEDEASEGDECAEEPLTPLTDASRGPIDTEDFTLLERLQLTYAAAVTQLDASIGTLLEHLGRQGLLDELVVIVTAERGLPLGEHGFVGDDRPWLHDELIHLPLLLRLPGHPDAGLRIGALTQPVDLLPTLLDLLGLPVPASHGHSLLPLVRGEKEQVRAYACVGLVQGEQVEWALRTPEWGFLLPVHGSGDNVARGPQLYVKPEDRWEVNNVVQHHLEFAERLEQTLRAFVEATGKPGPLEPPALPAEESAEPNGAWQGGQSTGSAG